VTVNPTDDRLRTTPSGLRWYVISGPEADAEEQEILDTAIDRLAALERGDRPSPWAGTARPGAGLRAWPAGSRYGASVRGDWGRVP
jgi:hypothetical protein